LKRSNILYDQYEISSAKWHGFKLLPDQELLQYPDPSRWYHV
jgi:hypothetical protein